MSIMDQSKKNKDRMKYVLTLNEKKELFESIPMKVLQDFIQERDIFIFAKLKEDIVSRMLMIGFSLDEMKELFSLRDKHSKKQDSNRMRSKEEIKKELNIVKRMKLDTVELPPTKVGDS